MILYFGKQVECTDNEKHKNIRKQIWKIHRKLFSIKIQGFEKFQTFQIFPMSSLISRRNKASRPWLKIDRGHEIMRILFLATMELATRSIVGIDFNNKSHETIYERKCLYCSINYLVNSRWSIVYSNLWSMYCFCFAACTLVLWCTFPNHIHVRTNNRMVAIMKITDNTGSDCFSSELTYSDIPLS